MKALRCGLVILGVLCAATTPAAGQTEWQRADSLTRRLPPSAFPVLPPAIRAELDRLGCTIPQTWSDSTPHNVVRGHFRSPSQTDWAVLCSANRQSRILVFWGGRPDHPDELAPAVDLDYLQGVGEGRIGFSRAIGAANGRYIREHWQAYGGPRPPPIDHQGIEDSFVEKMSVVYYWYQGKWLALTGAD